MAATLLLAAALAAALVGWAPWRRPSPSAPMRVTADLGADVSLVNQGATLALSPDGSLLAFVAPGSPGGTSQLYLRLNRLEVTGEPVPILEGVAAAPTGTGTGNGAAQFAVSGTGTLVYLPGVDFAGTPIDWLDPGHQNAVPEDS